MECYKVCISHNMAEAAVNLGTFYYNGIHVEKNEKYAYMLFERAYFSGIHDEYAEYCMADIRFRIGKCKLKGIGTQTDVEEAYKWLREALEGFYSRRKTDPFVRNLIKETKKLIHEVEMQMDEEIV